jgi:hypothetical protein
MNRQSQLVIVIYFVSPNSSYIHLSKNELHCKQLPFEINYNSIAVMLNQLRFFMQMANDIIPWGCKPLMHYAKHNSSLRA